MPSWPSSIPPAPASSTPLISAAATFTDYGYGIAVDTSGNAYVTG